MLISSTVLRRTAYIGVRNKFSWNHDAFVKVGLPEITKHLAENKEWAASSDARSLLRFAEVIPTQQIDAGDILEYIHKRVDAAPQVPLSAPTVRALSAVLTFPLTMSYALSLLFPAHHQRDRLNILVVGARSESSLPLLWWREMLYNKHDVLHHNLRMVGPHLQLNRTLDGNANCSISIKDRHKHADEVLERTLTVTNNFTSVQEDRKMHPDFSKLHEHPDCAALLRWADVFVMYNPGYGNSNLQASWEPSIRLLLETRKPIVCTAYGAHDLDRDLHALDRISADVDDQEFGEPIDFVIPPHENPFKTLKCTADSREEGDQGVVITNYAIYAVQAK